jgi:AcrR family transcriptional regulator
MNRHGARPTGASGAHPLGRDAVMDALTDATIDLIVEKGLSMSVREIAARAGVNHGLVHTYFGSKDGLLTAAFATINERAADELDERGFPPPDLAERRGGELAKALARVMLESVGDPYPSHPILTSWRQALVTDRPDLDPADVDEQILIATALGLGWALFADHLTAVLGLEPDRRADVASRVADLVAEFGGIPERAHSSLRAVGEA